jgi:hypothetical protein
MIEEIVSNETENLLALKRYIKLKNGNTIIAEKTEPFGFWRIHYERGKLPEYIADQSWTNFDKTLEAVKAYLASIPPEPTPRVEKVKLTPRV